MSMSKEQDLYEIVMRRVTKVREQGEPPKSDLLSLDSFVCDLCKAVIERSGLVQCPFCGRWICRTQCWDMRRKACISCAGVIKLCKEGVKPLRTVPSSVPPPSIVPEKSRKSSKRPRKKRGRLRKQITKFQSKLPRISSRKRYESPF